MFAVKKSYSIADIVLQNKNQIEVEKKIAEEKARIEQEKKERK